MGVVWEVVTLGIFCFVILAKLNALLLTKEMLWIWRSIGPSQLGSISFAVLPLVSTLRHSTSFIPPLFFRTIWYFSLCCEMGNGRLGYCVHLLQLWFYSHLSDI